MGRGRLRIASFRRPGRSLFILLQIRFSLGRGLLNRAGVVVLVARQCRSAGECFLAVRVGAFVWPFARVDATVPC
jgi:hypothetical protein